MNRITFFGRKADEIAASHALIAQLRADLAASDAALVAERARYDALLQTVLAMKQAAATLPPIVPTPEQVAKIELQEPDELAALIDVQCGRDYRKRAMMLAQLKTDRAAGVAPDDIRAAILKGVQSDGVPL